MPNPPSSPIGAFVIVDNHQDETIYLSDLLHSLYPRVPVFPNDKSHPKLAFTSWDEAIPYILRVKNDNVVAFLDLALPNTEEYSDVIGGLENGRTVQAAKHDWILIAFTRFSVRAQSEQAFHEVFDGVLEKGCPRRCKGAAVLPV